MMTDRHELEALFLAHLATIDRVLALTAGRQGIRGDDALDFASWAKSRLIEDDYAVLQKFRGASALTTYLVTVIVRLGQEYRAQRWGRWRASAAGRRDGPLGIRLEQLIYRDGLRLTEAARVLRSSGETDLSDGALAKMLAQYPARAPHRPGDDDATSIESVADSAGADDQTLQDEADEARRHTGATLSQIIQQLPTEDQIIIKMRFWLGTSVTDIARALRLEQKPLYRRIDRLLAVLRERLEQAGISAEQIRASLGEALGDVEPPDSSAPRPADVVSGPWRVNP